MYGRKNKVTFVIEQLLKFIKNTGTNSIFFLPFFKNQNTLVRKKYHLDAHHCFCVTIVVFGIQYRNMNAMTFSFHIAII